MKKVFFFLLAASLGIGFFAWKHQSGNRTDSGQSAQIVIGSKDFTESIVLAYLMADIIEEETGLKVERRVNLGGSNIALKGLLNHEIHMYPEYTATVLMNLYPEETPSSDPEMVRVKRSLEKDSLEFPNLFGFKNCYEVAVTRQIAEKYNLKTIEDLAKISHKLAVGCDFETIDRPDAFQNLKKQYGLEFKDVKIMNRGIMYRSLQQGAVDVVIAFTTEGQVLINDLVLLEDNLHLFPAYQAGPLIHQDILTTYPEIRAALAKLEGQITDEEMRAINVKIEFEGLKARQIAHEFLQSKGLVK